MTASSTRQKDSFSDICKTQLSSDICKTLSQLAYWHMQDTIVLWHMLEAFSFVYYGAYYGCSFVYEIAQIFLRLQLYVDTSTTTTTSTMVTTSLWPATSTLIVYTNSSTTTPVKAFVSSLSSKTLPLWLQEEIEEEMWDDTRNSRRRWRKQRLRIQSQSSASLPLWLRRILEYELY